VAYGGAIDPGGGDDAGDKHKRTSRIGGDGGDPGEEEGREDEEGAAASERIHRSAKRGDREQEQKCGHYRAAWKRLKNDSRFHAGRAGASATRSIRFLTKVLNSAAAGLSTAGSDRPRARDSGP
jgi:hypothetical protein